MLYKKIYFTQIANRSSIFYNIICCKRPDKTENILQFALIVIDLKNNIGFFNKKYFE